MTRSNQNRLRNRFVVATTAALLGGSWASAVNLPYTVSVTPTANLTNVYVANFVLDTNGDSNLDVEQVASSIPANTTATFSGANSFSAPGAPLDSFSAYTTVFGVYTSPAPTNARANAATTVSGISIGYNSVSYAGVLAAGAAGADTSYNGQQIPGYDASSGQLVPVSSDYTEADLVQRLQDYTDYFGTPYTFAQNLINTNDYINSTNLDGSVPVDVALDLINYSNGTPGGTASIVQTVQSPEPASLLLSGVAGVGWVLRRRRR